MKQERNRGHRTYRVEVTFGVPAGDSRVEDCVRESEEHLRVLVDGVMITCGDELCEQIPMSGGQLRMRTVGPIFRDHLLLVVEPGTQSQQILSLLQKGCGPIQRRPETSNKCLELIGRSEGKGNHLEPLRADKCRSNNRCSIVIRERLPVIWIENCGKIADWYRARFVLRNIAGVIRVGQATRA